MWGVMLLFSKNLHLLLVVFARSIDSIAIAVRPVFLHLAEGSIQPFTWRHGLHSFPECTPAHRRGFAACLPGCMGLAGISACSAKVCV